MNKLFQHFQTTVISRWTHNSLSWCNNTNVIRTLQRLYLSSLERQPVLHLARTYHFVMVAMEMGKDILSLWWWTLSKAHICQHWHRPHSTWYMLFIHRRIQYEKDATGDCPFRAIWPYLCRERSTFSGLTNSNIVSCNEWNTLKCACFSQGLGLTNLLKLL